MVKKSILLSVSVFFLLFIGVSDYGYACHRGLDSTDGGGCGKVDGDSSNTFQVHLAGAFVFDSPAVNGVMDVVLNGRRTIARSADNKDVYMSRPDSDPEQRTWDGVFVTCPLLGGRQVETIFVGDDDWRISINTGEIRLKFPHMQLTDSVADSEGVDIEEVDLHLQLIGDLDLNDGRFTPASKDYFDISLDRFDIRGPTVQGIHPREKCVLDVMSFQKDLDQQPPTLTVCGKDVATKDCRPTD